MIKLLFAWMFADRNAPFYMEQGHRRYYATNVPFHYLPVQQDVNH